MSKKLVIVCGATGGQGGSVVSALLADGRYAIRGLTRDISSLAAQALTAKGVEMVFAQPADRESVMNAFEGAYAVFGVTIPSFVAASEVPNEYEQGKNLVDACKANNVPLFVWSSLPSVTETSGGKYTAVTAFDEKAQVDKYIKSVKQPAVVFKTGGFTSNLIKFHQLRRGPHNPSKWHIYYPWIRGTTPQLKTYVEKDLGPAVLAVIAHWEDLAVREELESKPIPMISYSMTGEEHAAVLSKVTGTDVDYVCDQPTEGLNAHAVLKQMYTWNDEQWITYPEGVPPPILLKLGVKFHTFEDYVRETVVPSMQGQQ